LFSSVLPPALGPVHELVPVNPQSPPSAHSLARLIASSIVKAEAPACVAGATRGTGDRPHERAEESVSVSQVSRSSDLFSAPLAASGRDPLRRLLLPLAARANHVQVLTGPAVDGVDHPLQVHSGWRELVRRAWWHP
jgi:hypothetical protein